MVDDEGTGSPGIHGQTPCRTTPNSIPRTESCWSSWRASNAHQSPYFTGCYRLPGLVSTASAAESFRSRCGSVRGVPVCSSQAPPLVAPQVGQGTDNICLRVRSFVFTATGYSLPQFESCSISDTFALRRFQRFSWVRRRCNNCEQK